jgi:hypothetical protein
VLAVAVVPVEREPDPAEPVAVATLAALAVLVATPRNQQLQATRAVVRRSLLWQTISPWPQAMVVVVVVVVAVVDLAARAVVVAVVAAQVVVAVAVRALVRMLAVAVAVVQAVAVATAAVWHRQVLLPAGQMVVVRVVAVRAVAPLVVRPSPDPVVVIRAILPVQWAAEQRRVPVAPVARVAVAAMVLRAPTAAGP